MATSNIKLFDQNKQNMLSDTDYTNNSQRQNGVTAGVASSQLHNKQSYQTSLVAYAIAQLMLANGYNANDSDAVSTFVNNLSNTILQRSNLGIANGVASLSNDGKIPDEQIHKTPFLTDVTATMLGLAGNPTVDDAFGAIATVLASRTKIISGNYVGDGTWSTSYVKSIVFGFEPKMVILTAETSTLGMYSSSWNRSFLWVYGCTSIGIANYDNPKSVTFESTSTGLAWKCTSPTGSAESILNASGTPYKYIAIG